MNYLPPIPTHPQLLSFPGLNKNDLEAIDSVLYNLHLLRQMHKA